MWVWPVPQQRSIVYGWSGQLLLHLCSRLDWRQLCHRHRRGAPTPLYFVRRFVRGCFLAYGGWCFVCSVRRRPVSTTPDVQTACMGTAARVRLAGVAKTAVMISTSVAFYHASMGLHALMESHSSHAAASLDSRGTHVRQISTTVQAIHAQTAGHVLMWTWEHTLVPVRVCL